MSTTTAPSFRASRRGIAPSPDGSRTVDGTRVTFLLVHGLCLSHLSFSRLARELLQHGDVVAPDLPGFGDADSSPARLTVDEYAASIEPVLDRIDGPVIVLGHSLGTQIALELALRRPERVVGVVFVGTVVDPAAPTLLGQSLRLFRDYLGEPPRTLLMVARCYLQGGPREFVRGTASMLASSTARRITQLTAPLLVLRGAHDPIAPEPWSRWLAKQVPAGRYRAIDGARHNCVHSAPSAVALEVAAFAADLAADSAALLA